MTLGQIAQKEGESFFAPDPLCHWNGIIPEKPGKNCTQQGKSGKQDLGDVNDKIKGVPPAE
ncbi:hypothetical protein NVIE_028740 [Nitrososphaera viennensis EN76]|uniref:Uncharacterized protein n=2 Tax=Nitrososphaera viennensis TaxID=1034015 RepID=A0A060HKV6_9ARCH|nr:hypothetical protein NVIE_028740 [Nitrososphaera viennensis EN76]